MGECMWKKLCTNDDIVEFMDNVCYFHDSCIKEIRYLSGAYVTENLSMYPINDRRMLRMVIQRQYEKDSMIELEFRGVKIFKLFPAEEDYTCEILDSTMKIKDDNIYWYDCGNLLDENLDGYTGTLICAAELRWRSIENYMGEKEFYHSEV